MVKIINVVGARPNFMKAAAVIHALRMRKGWSLQLVHTDQHYDEKLSKIFFDELGMPKPDLHLGVGSGTHAWQTAQVMLKFEPVVIRERPSLVIVYGDINSTLACSLVCAKLGVPVAHVEAGLRSFDRSMPEEVNRILTDHMSEFLFTTEPSGRLNLMKEGVPEKKIFFVGNVMADTLLRHRDRARKLHQAERWGLTRQGYGLLTLHRPSNVDVPEILCGILDAMLALSAELPIIFPCHPRTREQLSQSRFRHLIKNGASSNGNGGGRLLVVDPMGYLEFLSLMAEARLVLTDSGGIQEETTVLKIPCLTLRENTERPVTIEQGTNTLVGTAPGRILTAAVKVLRGGSVAGRVPELWDGKAAERIAMVLEDRVAFPALSGIRIPETSTAIEPGSEMKGVPATPAKGYEKVLAESGRRGNR